MGWVVHYVSGDLRRRLLLGIGFVCVWWCVGGDRRDVRASPLRWVDLRPRPRGICWLLCICRGFESARGRISLIRFGVFSHPVVPSGKMLSISKPNFSTSEKACNSLDLLRYFGMLSSSSGFPASSPVISR